MIVECAYFRHSLLWSGITVCSLDDNLLAIRNRCGKLIGVIAPNNVKLPRHYQRLSSVPAVNQCPQLVVDIHG